MMSLGIRNPAPRCSAAAGFGMWTSCMVAGSNSEIVTKRFGMERLACPSGLIAANDLRQWLGTWAALKAEQAQ